MDSCRRSPGAYPNIVVDGLNDLPEFEVVKFEHLACSGAKSYNKASDRPIDLPEQVVMLLRDTRQFLPSQVTLVSITIGADDFDFGNESLKGTRACLSVADFNDEFKKVSAAVEMNVEFYIRRMMQRMLSRGWDVKVVLTDVYNPFNGQSILFGVMKANPFANPSCRSLGSSELHRRTEAIVHSLNRAVLNAAGSLMADPAFGSRVRLVRLHDAFHGHESPQRRCGGLSPTTRDTWIQFPRAGLFDLAALVLKPGIEVTKLGLELAAGNDCFHPNERGAAVFALGSGACRTTRRECALDSDCGDPVKDPTARCDRVGQGVLDAARQILP